MRPHCPWITLFCGLLAAGCLPAVPALAAVTGQETADGAVFKMDGATLRLQVWTDRVIRVTYAPGDALPETKSLSVIARPSSVPSEYRVTPDAYFVATGSVEARVDRQSGAVSFSNPKGGAYLAEAPGGRIFSPTALKDLDDRQAEQQFVLAPDEAIFGLGQQANGPWNYRPSTSCRRT